MQPIVNKSSAMGDEAFQVLLKKHNTRMHVSTCYPLGPFGLDQEIPWVKKMVAR